jgi:hypothetical protein
MDAEMIRRFFRRLLLPRGRAPRFPTPSVVLSARFLAHQGTILFISSLAVHFLFVSIASQNVLLADGAARAG